MNRKEAAELSPFIKAFGEGRIIEFSSITDVSKAWREVTDFPIGMIKNFKFRIKPEPSTDLLPMQKSAGQKCSSTSRLVLLKISTLLIIKHIVHSHA